MRRQPNIPSTLVVRKLFIIDGHHLPQTFIPSPCHTRPLKDDYTKGNTPGCVKVLINFLDSNDDRVEDNRLRWRKIMSEINSDEADDDV